CRQLVNHLIGLERQGLINVWYDHSIKAGEEWGRKIEEHLNAADIILLLISSDSISSYYCHDIEMNRALERHAAGDACVIPVILRAVDWRGMPFSKLQALPAHGEPVMAWKNIDSAFADVAQGIRRVIERLSQG
ncbi:MAG: TIR domain-containing protein, partial [Blastocatellia bacterium]